MLTVRAHSRIFFHHPSSGLLFDRTGNGGYDWKKVYHVDTEDTEVHGEKERFHAKTQREDAKGAREKE